MGGAAPVAMICLDPQVLEYGRELIDKKDLHGLLSSDVKTFLSRAFQTPAAPHAPHAIPAILCHESVEESAGRISLRQALEDILQGH
ncbi:unnamed protein product [Cladocopium goreaui]|uniref:Uncharacterized protein n=1 Tax=Cladocopium goreaui TaxID=2562237 RepID=A0A9P1BVU4_9DINO|nr:unnamed protein product [Cladocopium goreaui]